MSKVFDIFCMRKTKKWFKLPLKEPFITDWGDDRLVLKQFDNTEAYFLTVLPVRVWSESIF